MGFLDRLKEGRERRRHDRDAADYTRRVDAWLRECQRATELCLAARQPGVSAGAAPVELWEGERLLSWWTGADLIAPRNTTVRTWTSASYRIGKKTTVRAGASMTQTTVDRPSPIDRGTLAITDRRVLFLGRTRSLDWQFRRLLGVTHDDSGTWSALHVSNRQRLHGVGYPRSHGDDVRFYLALAVALFRGEEADFSETLESDTFALLASPPPTPAGVAVDGRVQSLITRAEPADLAAATKAIEAPTAAPPRLVAGFGRTRLPVVNTAAKLMGFRTAVVQAGQSADAAQIDDEMRRESSTWAAVVEGDVDAVAALLDGVPSATVRFVTAEVDVLDELGVDEIDDDRLAASESGHTGAPDEIAKALEADGYRCQAVALAATSGENDVAVLDVVAQVSRWIKDRPQAVVLHGPIEALERFRAATTAHDVVAYVAPPADLARLGLADADSFDVATDDDAAVGLGLSSPPITVAGRTVPNPAEAVARYLVDHAGTVMNYDALAGTVTAIESAVVRATRRPWMNSRISADEGDWFIERGRSAPWDLVDQDARLIDADASAAGGVYDSATVLWDHFFASAPKRVSVAKVSKVLHLMRPALYPILDSRLAAFYDVAAKDAARDVGKRRPDLAKFKRLQWEAIRRDVVANQQALDELRAVLKHAELPLPAEVVGRLSDVRLMDILAWAAAGGPEDEPDD
ncbi:MAG TPA: DUF6308 family protein [Acidimicrobiales bacterium]|nr:DUF6308 family protein [Acidimicrobiales bacterium]